MTRDKAMWKILKMHAVSSGLAASLVVIFIPVYLLELGHSLAQVMAFLIIQHVVIFAGAFAAVFSTNNLGLVRTLRVRFLFLFIYLFLLYTLQASGSIPIYLVAVIGGLEAAFYWMPVNILFTRYANTKDMAKQMSTFFVLPEVLGLSAFVGGLVAAYLGFPALFLVAFLINIVAVYFLNGLEREKTDFQFTLRRSKEVWQRNKSYFISEFFDNINEETVGVIFPIVAWISLQSVIDVGFVGTLIGAGMMAFTLVVGRFADRFDRIKMMRVGALLLIITWAVAFYAHSTVGFYMVSILLGFFIRFFLIPYNAMLFTNAKKDDAQFIVLRELPVISARVFVFAMAILLSFRLELVFFAAMASLLYFFVFNPSKSNT